MGICNNEERRNGRSYPRTCPTCRLGRCIYTDGGYSPSVFHGTQALPVGGSSELGSDEIETLRQRVAELERYRASAMNEIVMIGLARDDAESALTEARARLAAAWDEGHLAGQEYRSVTGKIRTNPYRRETGQ